MVGGTDLLSYALLFFIGWVYLPYAVFRLAAEVLIDLGRRRDATQLEEIVAACLPAVPLNLLTYVFASLWSQRWTVDWAAIASIFGRDRGAIADYIYAGQIEQPFYYTMLLWIVSLLWGGLYGRAARSVCRREGALDGAEHVMNSGPSSTELLEKAAGTTHRDAIGSSSGTPIDEAGVRLGGDIASVGAGLRCESKAPIPIADAELMKPPFWNTDRATLAMNKLVDWSCLPWKWFFHESFVPLYTWREQSPKIRIETTDHHQYYAQFSGYEKTTDGRLDAVHIVNVYRTVTQKSLLRLERVRHAYLKWSQVAEMHVIGEKDYEFVKCEFTKFPGGSDVLLPIKAHRGIASS